MSSEQDYRNYLKIANILRKDLLIEDNTALKAIMWLIDDINCGKLTQDNIDEIFNYIKNY